MDAFTIRLAERHDVATIARHRAEMFRDIGDLHHDHYDALVRATREYLTQAIDAGEYVGWLANPFDRPDVIAAGAGLQIRTLMPRPDRGGTSLIGGRQGLIVNVFTERPYRRLGLARQLMERVLAWAKEHHIGSVVLHASSEGRTLYDQLGFVPTSEMRYAGDLTSG
jgi:GNAT superfamily N-acetyltransferase